MITKHLIAVGEPLGNIQRPLIIFIQFDGDMLEVSGALGPQVNDYIKYSAPRTPNEFGLGSRGILEVHSADRTCFPIVRNVGLSNNCLQPMCFELFLAERSSKEASRI